MSVRGRHLGLAIFNKHVTCLLDLPHTPTSQALKPTQELLDHSTSPVTSVPAKLGKFFAAAFLSGGERDRKGTLHVGTSQPTSAGSDSPNFAPRDLVPAVMQRDQNTFDWEFSQQVERLSLIICFMRRVEKSKRI